jgi:hypothetical protein
LSEEPEEPAAEDEDTLFATDWPRKPEPEPVAQGGGKFVALPPELQ